MSEAAIERHIEGDALSRIVGGGDTRALLEEVERNVRDVIDVARARGFVRKYGEGQQHEFYGLPAWQLLGLTYGLVPYLEWSRQIDGGWEARSVVKTRDGQEVSAAEAMCLRSEPNRRNASEHTLRAMASTRANRNALRSCLGAALVLAGFDFADPEAPATKGQVGILHQLERDLGWPHDDAHKVAAVESYKDLNREQASEIIDAWTELRDDLARKAGGPGEESSPDISSTRPRPSDPSGAGMQAIGEPASEVEDHSGGRTSRVRFGEGRRGGTNPGGSSPRRAGLARGVGTDPQGCYEGRAHQARVEAGHPARDAGTGTVDRSGLHEDTARADARRLPRWRARMKSSVCENELHEGDRVVDRRDLLELRREWRRVHDQHSLHIKLVRRECRTCMNRELELSTRQETLL